MKTSFVSDLPSSFVCFDCNKTIEVNKTGNGASGYAIVEKERWVCYDCCAARDRKYMEKNGKISLYWDGKKITNWPGTLSFNPTARKRGKHNMARTREDVWFIGPDKKPWHGTQYGQNTQIIHCQRVK